MRKVFHAAMAKASDKAEGVEANVTDPSEAPLVRKFNLSRAPMPLVLALAPNGAVTGGFPAEFDEEKLLGALVSPGMAPCLKGLQQRKLVLLCVQNQATKSNEAAMRGVRDFERGGETPRPAQSRPGHPGGRHGPPGSPRRRAGHVGGRDEQEPDRSDAQQG